MRGESGGDVPPGPAGRSVRVREGIKGRRRAGDARRVLDIFFYERGGFFQYDGGQAGLGEKERAVQEKGAAQGGSGKGEEEG